MPANKNALIRYKTIDNCLRNQYRRWTIQDLVDACSDALADAEGIYKGVSLRTVQADLQLMRSDKLGYNAPIEVYDNKYYRYADPDYSITSLPFSENDISILQEAVNMIRQFEDFECFTQMSDVIGRLQDTLAISRNDRTPIINFDSVPNLKGLKWLSPLYNYIVNHQPLKIAYRSFKIAKPKEIIVHPYLLKEYRNRWFLYCGRGRTNPVITNLALDRIETIEPIGTEFKEIIGFDPIHYFDDIIGVTKITGNKPIEIVFRAHCGQVGYISTKPLHQSQKKIRDNADGSADFSITVIPNHELYSILMSYNDGITVLSPKDIVDKMKQILSNALDNYRMTNPAD